MNALPTMPSHFFRYYHCNNEVSEIMTTRTEQQWTALFDATVTSIIGGRCANDYFGDFSIDSIISETIRGADLLVKKLKEREETEN